MIFLLAILLPTLASAEPEKSKLSDTLLKDLPKNSYLILNKPLKIEHNIGSRSNLFGLGHLSPSKSSSGLRSKCSLDLDTENGKDIFGKKRNLNLPSPSGIKIVKAVEGINNTDGYVQTKLNVTIEDKGNVYGANITCRRLSRTMKDVWGPIVDKQPLSLTELLENADGALSFHEHVVNRKIGMDKECVERLRKEPACIDLYNAQDMCVDIKGNAGELEKRMKCISEKMESGLSSEWAAMECFKSSMNVYNKSTSASLCETEKPEAKTVDGELNKKEDLPKTSVSDEFKASEAVVE